MNVFESYNLAREKLYQQIIKSSTKIITPYGIRDSLYADFTATNRPLPQIERVVTNNVLPYLANVHSDTSELARQSDNYIEEGRNIVHNYLKCDDQDAIIFASNGCTGAIERFIKIMQSQNWYIKKEYIQAHRWHTYMCNICNLILENETEVKNHMYSHEGKIIESPIQDNSSIISNIRYVNFLFDISLHHSAFLPFVYLKNYIYYDENLGKSICVVFQHSFINIDYTTCEINKSILEEHLKYIEFTSRSFDILCFVVINNSSNVTGIRTNIHDIADIAHQYKAYIIVDHASALGYHSIEISSPTKSKLDVNVMSTHKLLGGISTKGILVVKRNLLTNEIPSLPGGGTIRYVCTKNHLFTFNKEHREEAGTPDIIACIRTGLTFKLNSLFSNAYIEERDAYLSLKFLEVITKNPNIQLLGPTILKLRTGEYTIEELNNYEINSQFITEQYIRTKKSTFSMLIKYGNDTRTNKKKPFLNQDKTYICYPTKQVSGGLYLHHNFVCTLLNDLFGIQIRAGCSCAGPFAHVLLGFDDINCLADRFMNCLEKTNLELYRPGFVRVSLNWCMNEDAVIFIGKCLSWVADNGWKILSMYDYNIETGIWKFDKFNNKKSRKWLTDQLTLSKLTTDSLLDVSSGTHDIIEQTAKYSLPGLKELAKVQGQNNNIEGHISVKALTTKINEAYDEIKESNGDKYYNQAYLRTADEIVNSLVNKKFFVIDGRRIRLKSINDYINLLDSSYVELLWFALPIDSCYSLSLYQHNKDISTYKPTIIKKSNYDIVRNSINSIFLKRPDNSIFEPVEFGMYDLNANIGRNMYTRDELKLNYTNFENIPLSKLVNINNEAPKKNIDIDEQTNTNSNKNKDEGAMTITEISVNCSISKKKSDSFVCLPKHNLCQLTTKTDISSCSRQVYKVTNSNLYGCERSLSISTTINISKNLAKSVGKAIEQFKMIEEGDRILIGLSGGKDSLSLLNILLYFQKKSPIKFEIAAATVNAMSSDYDPTPLITYIKALNIEYHMLNYPIIELAHEKMRKPSLCSFCARIKRGLLYTCMIQNNYNKLALAHHMDDFAESLLMSAFYNGILTTMKAKYQTVYCNDKTKKRYNLNIIRPLVFTREKDLLSFAKTNNLPIISDNCPACFTAPTERLHMKQLLAQIEHTNSNVVYNLSKAMMPIMSIKNVQKTSVYNEFTSSSQVEEEEVEE